MSIELYRHNLEAYERVKEMLEEKGKACIIHPTGTGKSYIAFKYVENHPKKHILWLGPSEYIFRLQYRKLMRQEGVKLPNLEFRTYAWLMKNQDYLSYLKTDGIILDEFHRVGAREWGKAVTALLEYNKEVPKLGLTATNIRYLDRRRDMAKEVFEGAIASHMELVEAMAKGILHPPVYVVATYTYGDKIQALEARINRMQNTALKKENILLLDRLRNALEQAEGMEQIFPKYIKNRTGKYIVFCTNTDKVYEMISKVPEWFKGIDRLPHVYAVHSNNPESEKEFRDFQEDDSKHIKLLFAVDMLNEGIHIDQTDGVILLRPTASPIVYKQQIGRALSADRTNPPVIFDLVNNFENLSNIENFQKELTETRKRLYRSGEYVSYEDFQIIDELRDSRSLFEQIQRNLEYSWDAIYDRLLEYKNQYGNVNVPKKYCTEDGLKLGRWLIRQCGYCRDGKLEEEYKNKLEQIGVDFRCHYDIHFEEMYQRLLHYKEQHGDLDIQGDYVSEDGAMLGSWVTGMRARVKSGAEPENSERIERLNKIGFIWDTLDYWWDLNFLQLKELYERDGVRELCRPRDAMTLIQWVRTQRNVRQGKARGNLTEDKIRKLDSIGFCWEVKSFREREYERKWNALLEYKKQYGNVLVHSTYVNPDGIALGAWVNGIRTKYRNNKLTKAEIELFESVGMVWDVYYYEWDRMYLEAEKYFLEHGTIIGAGTMRKDDKLANWLSRQIGCYKFSRDNPNYGELSEEQICKLERLGIQWNTKSNRVFEKGLEKFKNYMAQYGNPVIIHSVVLEDGFKLGDWCGLIRTQKRQGKLSEEKIRLLEEAGFVWDYTEHYWNRMYQCACNYYKRYGNLRVNAAYVEESGEKLGQWISCMRKRRKNLEKGKCEITQEQIQKLDQIGMIWDASLRKEKRNANQII